MSKNDRLAMVLSGVWLIIAVPVTEDITSGRSVFFEYYLIIGVLPVFLPWGVRWIRGDWSLDSPAPSTQSNVSKSDRVAIVLSGAWLLICYWLGGFLIAGVLPVFIAWGVRWIRGRWFSNSAVAVTEDE